MLVVKAVVLVMIVIVFLFINRGFSVESLFVDSFILDIVNDLVGADFDFLEDMFLIRLGLYLNGFIDHITELVVPLIELSISLDQGIISWCV